MKLKKKMSTIYIRFNINFLNRINIATLIQPRTPGLIPFFDRNDSGDKGDKPLISAIVSDKAGTKPEVQGWNTIFFLSVAKYLANTFSAKISFKF